MTDWPSTQLTTPVKVQRDGTGVVDLGKAGCQQRQLPVPMTGAAFCRMRVHKTAQLASARTSAGVRSLTDQVVVLL